MGAAFFAQVARRSRFDLDADLSKWNGLRKTEGDGWFWWRRVYSSLLHFTPEEKIAQVRVQILWFNDEVLEVDSSKLEMDR